MTDPREAKLPMWAQVLIVHERMNALVRFPNEPEPTPAAIADENGYGPKGQTLWDLRRRYVYSFSVTIGGVRIFKHWVGPHGHLHHDERERFGSRGYGKYYLTEGSARLAARHDCARLCAHMMYDAQFGKACDD